MAAGQALGHAPRRDDTTVRAYELGGSACGARCGGACGKSRRDSRRRSAAKKCLIEMDFQGLSNRLEGCCSTIELHPPAPEPLAIQGFRRKRLFLQRNRVPTNGGLRTKSPAEVPLGPVDHGDNSACMKSSQQGMQSGGRSDGEQADHLQREHDPSVALRVQDTDAADTEAAADRAGQPSPLISFNHGVAEYSLGPKLPEGERRSRIWWKLPAPGDRLWVREAFWIQKYDDDTFRPAELDASNTRWRYVADGADGAPLDPMGAAGSAPVHPHTALGVAPHAHRGGREDRAATGTSARKTREPKASSEYRIGKVSSDTGHYTCPDLAIPYTGVAAKISFSTLWESIHGEEAWIANPWVVRSRSASSKPTSTLLQERTRYERRHSQRGHRKHLLRRR